MENLNTSIFSTAILEEWKTIDADNWQTMVAEILDMFLSTSSGRRDKLIEAWKKNDWKAVREAAHALKSSCGSVGALKARSVLDDVENWCVEGRTDKASLALKHFGALFEESVGEIRRYREQNGPAPVAQPA